MKTEKLNGMWGPLRAGFLLIMLLCMGETALAASLASNTQLQNVVTVKYKNLADVQQTDVISSTIITVNLVRVAPTITFTSSNPVDTSITGSVSETDTVELTYQITTNSNGPDDFHLAISESTTDLGDSDINGVVDGTTPYLVGFLGATTIAEAITFDKTASATTGCLSVGGSTSSGTCVIKVPNDDAAAANGVNYIAGLDEVRIFNGVTELFCDVTAVDDSNGGLPFNFAAVAAVAPGGGGTGNAAENFSTISVNNCGTDVGGTEFGTATYAAAQYDGVFETKSVSYNVIVDQVSSGATGSTDVTTVAEDVGGAQSTTATGPQTIVVFASNIVVVKYVRNVTTSAAGDAGGADFVLAYIDGGTTNFYRSGITANPGEFLEYAIVIFNDGGDVKDVIVEDPEVPFTSYQALSLKLWTPTDLVRSVACATDGTNPGVCTLTATSGSPEDTVTDDTLATGGDFGGLDGANKIFAYAGTGGDETDLQPGGDMNAAEVSMITFQVQVSP